MSDWTGAAESNVISVTINEKPQVSINGVPTSCASTLLTVVTNATSPSYEWYKDLTKLPDTGSSLTVNASGSYRVEVTDGATSCKNFSAAFPVTVNLIPSAFVTGTTTACATTTLTAVSDASNPSFTWYKDNVEIPGQTTSTLIVNTGGAYKYKVVNGTSLCENTSASTSVTIKTLTLADRVVDGTTAVCSGTSALITINLSETGVNYQLRNSAGNVNIGSAVSGTGGTITMSTGILPSTTTINILATRVATGCNVQLNETETITVDPPSEGGSISVAAASIEYGSSAGTMTLTGYTGSIIKWQKQPDSGEWQDIANTSATYSETPSSPVTSPGAENSSPEKVIMLP
ncbi:MAG TPA: hypothetical protein VHO68_06500 [Bacteroidales bacterium]|nr:hypothetical protein [Bacteroidales bacterium]